ncbi:MAG: peptidylprolyl isomerase [candidate division KSB1 bacterium]|nr:peptidylprolyl isomerase [candidate division KSB1 bacterium]MDZ7294053.1 peptidylprolyl isomerase [candidate division KSB1 bacterium]MDZ7337278.1 peptidylprolyl isomerase [candidate division KSB1 bacterium]MDZ7378516.1 peptidylprolyl isomerase [candidate division KSB1 bacterium]MDZ7384599.1 peptidylprolyl isomerase [candidate division KSB1 bacterium]
MKRAMSIIAVTLAGFVILAGPLHAQRVARIVYVSAESENLRAAPAGQVIGKVNRGASLEVLEETDKWMRVQVTAWIWKASVNYTRPFDKTTALRAQHILVKTRAEAEEILRELRAGADFAEVAKKKSIGPTAAAGGDLGYFNPDDFDPAFARVITALKVGEISDIVETKIGFSIFKRLK